MRALNKHVMIIALLGLLGTVASCSSGGGGGGNSETTTGNTTADLAGSWYSVGLKTPVKNTSNVANFGYDVDQLIISSSGTSTSTTISTSDDSSTDTGTLSISNDGTVSVVGDPAPHYIYLNASKDVMVELWTDAVTGEQQLWANVKKAASYTMADLAGSWYSVGLKTPRKNTSNVANFGYDVDQLIISSSGTYTSTTISTSDDSSTDTGTLSISNDGTVSVVGDPAPHYIYLNASKDVMVELWTDAVTGEQQLWGNVKKAASYTTADLAGTWYSVGLKSPVKNTSNAANFGYDVDQVVINNSGAFTSTTISTSDDSTTDTGTVSIDNEGRVSIVGDTTPHYIYLNAGKNVMVEFWHDVATGQQQMWLNVKKTQ